MLKGTLINISTGGAVEFQFNPDTLDISHNPKWAKQEIPGRSHPHYMWISGGEHTLSFTLKLFLKDLEKWRTHPYPFHPTLSFINFVESLTFPSYKDGVLTEPPPLVLVKFGQVFNYKTVDSGGNIGAISSTIKTGFRGIVADAKIKMYDLFDPVTLMPLRADIDLVIDEVPIRKSISSNEVAGRAR